MNKSEAIEQWNLCKEKSHVEWMNKQYDLKSVWECILKEFNPAVRRDIGLHDVFDLYNFKVWRAARSYIWHCTSQGRSMHLW